MSVANTAATGAAANNNNKQVIFKNHSLFTNYLSKINNTQIEDVHDIDVVMSIYNLTEYSDIYSKESGSLWQYYRNKPTLDNNNKITDFSVNKKNNTSFKFKQKITWKIGNDDTKVMKQ